MTKLPFLICTVVCMATSSVFAGTTQLKYEAHYSVEKSSQVKHLSISQVNADEMKIKQA